MNSSAKIYYQGQLLKKQQGNILVMFTIGLFALIAMAALALDGGHLLLNKSRLQNIADAAALHAAKTLESGGSHVEARSAVLQMIGLNIAHNDNFEINDALEELSGVDTSDPASPVYVDFSESADPFISSTGEDALYVKVEVRNLSLNNFLADIMDFLKQVSATALAGPSSAIDDCYSNLVPLLVCGAFDSAGDPLHDGEVDAGGNPTHAFGLPLKELFVLKAPANSDPTFSAGNFQFADFGTGKNTVKEMLAGADINETDICLTADEGVATETGVAAGPTLKATNTRLGEYQGDFSGTSSEYPRDLNTCQGPQITLDASGAIETTGNDKAYRYSQYSNDAPSVCENVASGNVTGDILDHEGNESGVERRILNVVIADCTGASPGKTTLAYKGTGCFFLTQKVAVGGTNSFIVGEFVEDCSLRGNPSGEAIDGNDTIVLFHVPGSNDS